MKYLGLFTTTYLDFRLGREDYHGLDLAYSSIFFANWYQFEMGKGRL